MTVILALLVSGLVSGFVDSIAGGGGLITLPALTFLFGHGLETIATNKVPGTLGAFVALFVYLRKGGFDLRQGALFTFATGLGSLVGAQVAPYLPESAFRWIMIVTCPTILWIVLNKQLWTEKKLSPLPIDLEGTSVNSTERFSAQAKQHARVIIAGAICGLYDGMWGPGGGTFMFLALLFFANLPLLSALVISKLANGLSAALSLTTYAIGGYVHWEEGILLAVGVSTGAFIGAKYATERAAQIIRPLLVVVVSLLILKLIF